MNRTKVFECQKLDCKNNDLYSHECCLVNITINEFGKCDKFERNKK